MWMMVLLCFLLNGCSSPGPLPLPAQPLEDITVIKPEPLIPWKDLVEEPTRTFCTSVAHIGDSTSTGLVKSYIRDPELRIRSQYAEVGVRELHFEADGGRSLVEHRSENENGVMVARRLRKAGFSGCWVVALGTNDAANIARGSHVPARARMVRLLEIIGEDPVLWVDVSTDKDGGYYATPNMQSWNEELEDLLIGYPTVVPYRWSADVREGWYVPDGIHYNRAGLTARAQLIPRALMRAFPERKKPHR
jgi:hypothetical protein